jgi:signal transduction histidine kinase
MEYGLWSSIITDIKKINAAGTVEVKDGISLELPGWDSGTEIILYRMIQELFQNAIKHSQASLIIVEAFVKGSAVKLAFQDNGVGFDVSSVQHSGSGLVNLEVRASAIGAHFELNSKPGDGTRIVITKEI